MKPIHVILFFFLANCCTAQSINDSLRTVNDSLRTKDSITIKDTLAKIPARDTISRDSILKVIASKKSIAEFYKKLDSGIYNHNTFYHFNNPVRLITIKRQWKGREPIFYLIIVLLLFFAVTKNTFSRYLADLFRVFFRTTLKQRQTRDQLMSAPLPSLLFNILYLLSAGLFITLVLQHFHIGDKYNFWILFVYSIIGLLIIYSIKFVALKLFGWILGVSEATNTYIFIVFTTNKIVGILLLPFIVGLSFMDKTLYEVVFSLSICVVAALFVYRFFLSFVSVRKQVIINLFHFLLYIIAFELAPLLLINKLLVSFFSETH